MSRNESKFGKKKSGNKFNREKTYVDSEADILLADKNQEIYKEERTIERHYRRVKAGLEEAEKEKEKEKEPILEPEVEPINKYDIKTNYYNHYSNNNYKLHLNFIYNIRTSNRLFIQ